MCLIFNKNLFKAQQLALKQSDLLLIIPQNLSNFPPFILHFLHYSPLDPSLHFSEEVAFILVLPPLEAPRSIVWQLASLLRIHDRIPALLQRRLRIVKEVLVPGLLRAVVFGPRNLGVEVLPLFVGLLQAGEKLGILDFLDHGGVGIGVFLIVLKEVELFLEDREKVVLMIFQGNMKGGVKKYWTRRDSTAIDIFDVFVDPLVRFKVQEKQGTEPVLKRDLGLGGMDPPQREVHEGHLLQLFEKVEVVVVDLQVPVDSLKGVILAHDLAEAVDVDLSDRDADHFKGF